MSEHFAFRRAASRKARLLKALNDLSTLRLCGPSDDPDEQTAVIESYKYLLIQIKTLAKGLITSELAEQLGEVPIAIESIYDVYDSKAHLDVIAPDIAEELGHLGHDSTTPKSSESGPASELSHTGMSTQAEQSNIPAQAKPRVFISYSWDSSEHKEWVLKFATRLHDDGVQVILDRWNLMRGGDKSLFMEKSVASSDFVILVCTPTYAKRANERAGGVGYEAMVITGRLAEKIDDHKFIPVLRAGDFESALPSWIKTKFGVDLRGDAYREDEYDDLLKTLLREPLGPRPTNSTSRTDKTDFGQPLAEGMIQMSLACKNDCEVLQIPTRDVIGFVLGEGTRHPRLFMDRFTSLSLIFYENVVLLSWDGSNVTVERILNRTQAYPLNDAWGTTLAAYRKATLLPYRSVRPGQANNPYEIRKALSVYRILAAKAGDFLKLLKSAGQDPPDVFQDLASLLEEAEFALDNDVFGTSIARLEAVLSTVHKLILRYAPQQSSSDERAHQPKHEIQVGEKGQRTVLVVDDDLGILEALKHALSDKGLAVTIASSATTAMRALVEREFDLVLTDLVMLGGADGREVVIAAKRSSNKTKVIVMTAFGRLSEITDLIKDGADDVFFKAHPGDNNLLARIDKLFSNSQ